MVPDPGDEGMGAGLKVGRSRPVYYRAYPVCRGRQQGDETPTGLRGHPTACSDGLLAPEMPLQCRGVGHRETGAVHLPPSMPMPEIQPLGPRSQGLTHLPNEPLQHFAGQPHAGLAVRRRRESYTGKMGHVSAGGVAMENLQDEQMVRGDGIERSLTPVILTLGACLLNDRRTQRVGQPSWRFTSRYAKSPGCAAQMILSWKNWPHLRFRSNGSAAPWREQSPSVTQPYLPASMASCLDGNPAAVQKG